MLRKDKMPMLEKPICDFTGGAVGHRFLYGGGRNQTMAKAVGMKGGKTPMVVDATAGLGRDAFLLASLGAEIILIERSPDMHRLLEDGLARARDIGGKVAEVISRMTLIYGDARDLLPTLSPEVVLVDPMHPPRTKKALVKKNMRLIREIVGSDEDSVELMKVAMNTASNRVVLKWPRRADPMEGIGLSSHQITGKSISYNVFMVG